VSERNRFRLAVFRRSVKRKNAVYSARRVERMVTVASRSRFVRIPSASYNNGDPPPQPGGGEGPRNRYVPRNTLIGRTAVPVYRAETTTTGEGTVEFGKTVYVSRVVVVGGWRGSNRSVSVNRLKPSAASCVRSYRMITRYRSVLC